MAAADLEHTVIIDLLQAQPSGFICNLHHSSVPRFPAYFMSLDIFCLVDPNTKIKQAAKYLA